MTGHSQIAERRDAVCELERGGVPICGIARRLGVSRRTVERDRAAVKDGSARETPVLHPGVIAVLGLRSNGMTYEEIAEELRVPAGTVQARMRIAVRDLYAYNTTHAVALAIRAGLI